MDIEPTLLAERTPDDADSLVSTNEPDTMANEQTWPTEEEMADAPANNGAVIPDAPAGTTPKRIKRVPKGTSEYQAAWILDDDDEDGDDLLASQFASAKSSSQDNGYSLNSLDLTRLRVLFCSFCFRIQNLLNTVLPIF